jgi:hypothetical protein
VAHGIRLKTMSIRDWRSRVERDRLTNREDDWQAHLCAADLSLTRTRFGGQGRSNLARKNDDRVTLSVDSSLDVSISSEEQEEDDDDELSEDESEKKVKPEASRVFLEVDALTATLKENCRCSECKSEVEVEMKTVCLATSIELTCTNPRCGLIYYSNPPAQVKRYDDDD